MSAKTHSMVLEGSRKMAIWEFNIPKIGPEDGLLKVEMVGICGTDVGIYNNKKTDSPWPYPLIMGHEIVGIVEEIGEIASKRHGVKKGDRAIISTNMGCGYCYHCRSGRFVHCQSPLKYGMNISCKKPPHLWGAYGEYLYIAPQAQVQNIGDIQPEEGVLISGVIANGIRWVRTKGGVTIGDTVVILGPGPQGLAGVIAAKESGASRIIVTGFSRNKKRLELAKEFGATDIIIMDEQDPLEIVRELTNGAMADVVYDATGSPAGARLLLDLVGKCGTVVLSGMYGFKEIPIVLDKIYAKEVTIKGVRAQDIASVNATINLVRSKKYPIEKMITHRFPLAEAEKAVQLAGGEIRDENMIKIVLVP